MTFLARDNAVACDERKSGDIVIERCDAAPVVLAMASLAPGAKLALVPVILAMARHACCRKLVAIEITGVARIALDLCMCGPERKFRVFIVVEADRDPLVLFVAAFALRSISSGVDILNLVAIDAGCPDPLVAFAGMARGARDITVCASQRKLGLVVIVRLHLTPCGFAMAIVARFPQTPLMWIDRLVTIEAASGSIAELYVLRVTAVALHRLVSFSKLEIRECVIERLTIKEDDVGVPSLVIGVTNGAFLFRRISLTPVKSLRRLTISGSVFVAPQAQARLRFS
jgi:hypothetical protein